MLHPKKHAPDFVCKKRYTTEFELQKGTRCTPFYIKKNAPDNWNDLIKYMYEFCMASSVLV